MINGEGHFGRLHSGVLDHVSQRFLGDAIRQTAAS
jgi:hypothetical protein